MRRPRQQRCAGGLRGGGAVVAVLVAAVLLAMLSLCLPPVDASSRLAGPPWEKGVATAVNDEVVGQEATVAEAERGSAVHERMEMEVSINDYPDSRANSRHNPSHP